MHDPIITSFESFVRNAICDKKQLKTVLYIALE